MSISGAPANAAKISASAVTGTLIAAGGGAGGFSTVRALNSMLGDTATQGEIAHLRDRFGDDRVDQFISLFDFAVSDAWVHAGKDNVSVPKDPSLSGHALANALINAGTDNGKFSTVRLLITLLTAKVAVQTEGDIGMKYGMDALTSFNQIGDTLFTDMRAMLASG
ncbi:MAG TPA: hypothetical protein VGN11_08790 [Candidatus Baltobacteraceae bacterium]|nr:hypothetical protein [Candidatus Baltobacteraceae bacterium]